MDPILISFYVGLAIASYCSLSIVLLLMRVAPCNSEIYNWPWKMFQAWRVRRKYGTDITLLMQQIERKYASIVPSLNHRTAKWLVADPIAYARALGLLQRKVGNAEIARFETYGFLYYKDAIFIRTAVGGQTIIALKKRGPVLYCVRVLQCVPAPEITLHQIFLWDRPKEFRKVAKRYPL